MHAHARCRSSRCSGIIWLHSEPGSYIAGRGYLITNKLCQFCLLEREVLCHLYLSGWASWVLISTARQQRACVVQCRIHKHGSPARLPAEDNNVAKIKRLGMSCLSFLAFLFIILFALQIVFHRFSKGVVPKQNPLQLVTLRIFYHQSLIKVIQLIFVNILI